jgi:hypothetical protein
MSDENRVSDFETRKFEHFDPDNMAKWLDYPPEEFIKIMVHELRTEAITIEKYTELLHETPQIMSMIITKNGQSMSVSFCLEVLLQSTRILNRLLATTVAYADAKHRTENRSDED